MLSILTVLIEFVFLGYKTSVTERSDILIIMLIILFSFAFFYDILKSKKLYHVQLPMMAGYLCRLFYMFWDLYFNKIFPLPDSGGDSIGFYEHARRVALGRKATYGGLYSFMMGKIFSWTGISRMYGQFLNILFSLITMYVIVLTFQRIGISKSIQRKVMWCVCLLPHYAIVSAIFLRESIIILLLTSSIYVFVCWFLKREEYKFWIALALVFLSAAFHSGTVGVAVGYIVVRFLYDANRKKFRLKAMNIMPTIILICIFVFLYTNYAPVLFGKMQTLETVSDAITNGGGSGGSTYVQYVGRGNTPVDFLISSVLRMPYFMFSPFPWQWRGVYDIIAFCFSSFFYFVTVRSAYIYLKNRQDERKALTIGLSIVAMCVVFVFAWGVSNTGTAIRHRDKLIAIFCILWASTASSDGNRFSINERKL